MASIESSQSSPQRDEIEDDRTGTTETSSADAALKARLSRKRTKTGCLTCRRRRIKCGEERPICRNCIKSKRQCEGYNQRVIFKPPTIDFRHLQNGAATITFPVGAMGLDMETLMRGQQVQIGADGCHSQLLPRPLHPLHPAYQGNLLRSDMQGPPPPHPYAMPGPPVPNQYMHQGIVDAHMPFQQWMDSAKLTHNPTLEAPSSLFRSQSLPRAGYEGPYGQPSITHHSHEYNPQALHDSEQTRVRNMSIATMPPLAPPHMTPTNELQLSPWSTTHSEPTRIVDVCPTMWAPNNYIPRPELARPIDHRTSESQTRQPSFSQISLRRGSQQISTESQSSQVDYAFQHYHEAHQMGLESLLEGAAIQTLDDDYYDVNSDEEMEEDVLQVPAGSVEERRALNSILKIGHLRIDRSISGIYMEYGALDSYRPERVANPLKNPATARVFAHFIHVTAPTIATCTRRMRGSHSTFVDGQVPFSKQGIWTYAMPMAALHHQGLLQAILAISSLQLARQTGSPTTPSYKHYAYALKRIHQEVGHPKKRHSVPVVAASLLLAVYELWSAEHVKWNSHLAGAGQLLAEIDYAGMHRQLRKLRFHQARFKQQWPDSQSDQNLQDQLDQIPEADDRIVNMLSGQTVNYGDIDVGAHADQRHSSPEPQLNIIEFEVQKDLFWWYAKQDMVQSIVSGNPLLVPYHRWVECPPRAPLNDPTAVYGSFDAIILLAGRIADFTVRDRRRKLKYIDSVGGRWRPPPGMQFGPPPSAVPPGQKPGPPSSAGSNASPQMPEFFGMAPPTSSTKMPSSYAPGQEAYESSSPSSDGYYDLEMASTAALREWLQIKAALQTFKSMLGEHFQPFGPDEQPPMYTPFGPALCYRSYEIACLWAFYNLCLIIAHRSHPDMPPHAHAATGIAAYETRQYALDTARIAAGLVVTPPEQVVDPSVGSAYCETCLPLFFAGVQFQDPSQRDWIVTRLFDVERRCGYGTAGIIAHGCQTAWYKAYKMGRGPPYERRYNETAADERMNGRWEHLDPSEVPPQESVTDRRFVRTKATARLHWAMGILGMEDDS